MNLSIIIVSYETKRLLRQCLRGLYHFPPHAVWEVIVVDNGSNDGTAEMVRQEFPEARLFVLPENLGYARGSNVAIKEARGEFILFMNTDIVVLRDSFNHLLQFMERRSEVGMVGPQLLNPDRTIQYSAYRRYNILTPFCRRTWLKYTAYGQRELARFLMLDWDRTVEKPVDWLMSSCLMVRRSALEQVGVFDERFFIYLADTDLCRRFWQKGWSVVYTPESVFIHLHHRQSAEAFHLTVIHLQDWLRYLWKWREGNAPETSFFRGR